MKLQHIAIFFNASKIPPTVSTTYLEKPVMLRSAKRKESVQVPDVSEAEKLRRAFAEAKASTKRRLDLPPAPKPDDAVNPVEALAEGQVMPASGTVAVPPGQTTPASAER